MLNIILGILLLIAGVSTLLLGTSSLAAPTVSPENNQSYVILIEGKVDTVSVPNDGQEYKVINSGEKHLRVNGEILKPFTSTVLSKTKQNN